MTRTAIITGASSGIGAAIARRLAAAEMNVVLAARRADKLETLAAEINAAGVGKAFVVPTDISKQADVAALVERANKEYSSVDVYVNNAGVMLSGAVTDGKLDDWENMIDVNVKGALYGLDAVIPGMVARGTGHIVNIASVSGLEVTKKSTVYSATKFAIRAISMGLEKELAHTGVRVTNISPGMVDTPLTTRAMMNRKPLAAADIANAVHYAVTQPDYVNVNEITVRPV